MVLAVSGGLDSMVLLDAAASLDAVTLVVATFDTHYVLVREAQLGPALAALHAAGHRVLREQPGAPVGP